VTSSGDEKAQPEASSQQAQPAASNEGAEPAASNESVQPSADLNWMKTESIRSSGESKEEFLRRLRDPDPKDLRR